MENTSNLGSRWSDYRPSKSLWFWSCVGCVAATWIVGFAFGGWVTSGTAATMSAQAAQDAKAQLAAAYCVSRFDAAPDASTKLAALQHTESWDRSDFIDKGGWANMPWVKQPIQGVADLCAQKLISASASPAKPAAASG